MKILSNWGLLSAGLLFLDGLTLSNAQASPNGGIPLWTNRCSGPLSDNNYPASIAVDNNGNVFVAGASARGNRTNQFVTIAYSGTGVPLWTNRYSDKRDASATSVAIDGGGNVFVTGYSSGDANNYSYATVAYSPAGVPLWTNRYKGPGNLNDAAIAMAVDASGNVFVTGSSDMRIDPAGQSSSYATIKYSNAGAPLWTNRYHAQPSSVDEATAIALDQDGSVFVTGRSSTYVLGYADYATVAYSSGGVPLWTNRYRLRPNTYNVATSVKAGKNSNVFVTGSSATLAYSTTGVPLWTNFNAYPGLRLAVDAGSNLFVTGISGPSFGPHHISTIAYSSTGVPLWTNQFPGPAHPDYDMAAIAVDRSGNVFVAGSSANGPTFQTYGTVAYSSTGAPLWTNCYSGPTAYQDDVPTAIAVDRKGNIFVTGESYSGTNGLYDYATVKYSAFNTRPVVICPTPALAECGTTTVVTTAVSDVDGDALSAVWTLNGVRVQTNAIAEGDSISSTNLSFTAVLSLGTNTFAVTVADSAGNSDSCSTTILVVDTTPPAIHSVTASPNVLLPADHRMVPVHLDALVTDACGPADWKIIDVSSDEAADSQAPGSTRPDWEVTGDHDLLLRAERLGQGNGRLYTITIQARDISGNVSEATVAVLVPHDRRSGIP